jgi:hypothetical protein
MVRIQQCRRLRRGHRSDPSAASPYRIADEDLLDLRRHPQYPQHFYQFRIGLNQVLFYDDLL